MCRNKGRSLFSSPVNACRNHLAVPVQLLRSVGIVEHVDRDLLTFFEAQERTWELPVVGNRRNDPLRCNLNGARANAQSVIGPGTYRRLTMPDSFVVLLHCRTKSAEDRRRRLHASGIDVLNQPPESPHTPFNLGYCFDPFSSEPSRISSVPRSTISSPGLRSPMTSTRLPTVGPSRTSTHCARPLLFRITNTRSVVVTNSSAELKRCARSLDRPQNGWVHARSQQPLWI